MKIILKKTEVKANERLVKTLLENCVGIEKELDSRIKSGSFPTGLTKEKIREFNNSFSGVANIRDEGEVLIFTIQENAVIDFYFMCECFINTSADIIKYAINAIKMFKAMAKINFVDRWKNAINAHKVYKKETSAEEPRKYVVFK